MICLAPPEEGKHNFNGLKCYRWKDRIGRIKNLLIFEPVPADPEDIEVQVRMTVKYFILD